MKIGYVRVSTAEQNTIRQEVLMKELNVDQVFIDHASGKNRTRAELNKLIEFARTGDTVIVESISRFARNTKDLLELIEMLHSKNVEFVSRKENIDTTSSTGKFMLTVFGAVAELEREYILQRQKEGIAIAKQEGVYKGRKKIVNNSFATVYDDWKKGNISGVQAMSKLNMKKSTFYRRVQEHEKGVIN